MPEDQQLQPQRRAAELMLLLMKGRSRGGVILCSTLSRPVIAAPSAKARFSPSLFHSRTLLESLPLEPEAMRLRDHATADTLLLCPRSVCPGSGEKGERGFIRGAKEASL